MSNLAVTNELFFDRTGMDSGRVEKLVGEALAGMDDGELFLEYSQSESVGLDDGRIKSASFDTTQGFGLRAVAGEAAGYAHASELSEAAIKRAATAVRWRPRPPARTAASTPTSTRSAWSISPPGPSS
jgi:TldD protein